MDNAITLRIGEMLHLRRGKDRIIYAGMPSEGVYSIVQRKADGYQGFAWNLYFPRKQTEIIIDDVTISVESVAPEEIRVRITG